MMLDHLRKTHLHFFLLLSTSSSEEEEQVHMFTLFTGRAGGLKEE